MEGTYKIPAPAEVTFISFPRQSHGRVYDFIERCASMRIKVDPGPERYRDGWRIKYVAPEAVDLDSIGERVCMWHPLEYGPVKCVVGIVPGDAGALVEYLAERRQELERIIEAHNEKHPGHICETRMHARGGIAWIDRELREVHVDYA